MPDDQDIENEFVRNVYSSRDLRLAHPRWLEIWPELKKDYGLATGLCLEISCTYRSPKAQQDLYKIGRTAIPIGEKSVVTHFDGVKNLSIHNIFPSRAIDVYAHAAGKIMAIWDIDAYEVLGPLADKFKLIWGGHWKRLKDRPHLEIPVDIQV